MKYLINYLIIYFFIILYTTLYYVISTLLRERVGGVAYNEKDTFLFRTNTVY